MTTHDQLKTAGENAVEIRTLNVRVAPLTLAMLAQVPQEDIIDMEAGALRGEPMCRVVTPAGAQVLWLRDRDLCRCVLPESAQLTDPLPEECWLRGGLESDRVYFEILEDDVSQATGFSEMIAALDPDGRFQFRHYRERLDDVLGWEVAERFEDDARAGSIGPKELEVPKQEVAKWLVRQREEIAAGRAELAKLVAERESRDAQIATLVDQLARLDQVFLL
ncbi:MAG: hypothetical protein CALGDGBN_03558 [Pseudomonadales bacterium]|nr:hypothetical protein [Pseudomonadales bacterium]